MRDFLKKLCKKYKISAFILFGSAALGKTNKLSDIDIAYLSKKPLGTTKENKLYLEITKSFKRADIDLVDVSNTGLVLKYAIVNTGKVVACADHNHLYNFVVKTRRDYLDTQYLRDVFFYYMKKRVKSGQFGR